MKSMLYFSSFLFFTMFLYNSIFYIHAIINNNIIEHGIAEQCLLKSVKYTLKYIKVVYYYKDIEMSQYIQPLICQSECELNNINNLTCWVHNNHVTISYESITINMLVVCISNLFFAFTTFGFGLINIKDYNRYMIYGIIYTFFIIVTLCEISGYT